MDDFFFSVNKLHFVSFFFIELQFSQNKRVIFVTRFLVAP